MDAVHAFTDLSTPEAFLSWVWDQEMKFEMTGGRLVMMAGASNPHTTIAVNVVSMLREQLRGRPCRPYNSDFMVQMAHSERYFPDASVACDETRDYTDRPMLVVEVLSPSTERFDRRVKLPKYLAARGLRYVLYVAQDRAHAELYRPDEPDGDVPITMTSLDGGFELPELEVTLTMADLYADVTFAAAAT